MTEHSGYFLPDYSEYYCDSEGSGNRTENCKDIGYTASAKQVVQSDFLKNAEDHHVSQVYLHAVFRQKPD